ncbi:MAG: LysR family transcriptional regulator [Coprococcus catus]|nr:LysR family transcriptional regulator [Coprococcus catus]
MELKQLEAFVAVVDYDSFSEAARHLFLTQPTVSAHVASLEKELDTKLISRTTKKLHVTPQGYNLYDSAVSMLKIRDHILNEFVGSHKQIIELGASTIPSSYVLPEVLSAFGQLNPDIYFHSELSDSMGIIQQVENGRLDFGLVGMTTDSSELIFIPFLEDELVIVTPVTPHYLEISKENVTIAAFLNEPFILREKGSGTKKAIDQYLEQQHIASGAINVVARMNDLEAVKRSIINGLGISILSAKSVQDLNASRQVLIFPLAHPAPTRKLYIVYKKEHALLPHVRRFIQFVRSYYQPQ